MISQSILPQNVGSLFDNAGLHHRPLLLAIDTDVTLEGIPQRQWLIATRDYLTVVAEQPENMTQRIAALAGRPSEKSSLPVCDIRRMGNWNWDAIQAVRTMAGVGSGTLQLQIAEIWIDILRFSNALADRFHKVSRRLETLRHALQDSSAGLDHSLADGEAIDDSPRCPACQLRLAHAEDACPRCLPRGQILQRLWILLQPHWKGGAALCVLTVVGVIAELLPPKLQQYMVDRLLMGNVASTVDIRQMLLVVVLALAISRVLLSVVAVIKGRLASVIGAGITCRLRLEMVQKLHCLAIAYYDRHQVGSMISRVAHDSEVLSGLMHQLTGGFLLQIVQLIGVGTMLLWLNVKLAAFTLIPVPLVFLGSWVFWRKVYPRYYRLWDASSKQMSVLSGMLSGIRVVKAFSQQDREYQRFQTAAEHLRDWRLWVEHASARYSAAMQIVFSLGGLIVWYVGGLDVVAKSMSLGELIAFLAYLAMFYAPLGALSNFTTWLTSFLSGGKRVLELLDSTVDIQDPPHPEPWSDPKGQIEFDHVTFGYDRNQPVLKDVSFDVRPGEMVGIVGRSGSGKSTMVNLLGRFYDVQEGAIRVDGIDIRSLSTDQLRDRIGFVFQDSFMFRGTIWKNLSYGRPETEIERGLASAKAAGAHDFICRTHLGYETQLGEHGAGLSGGERQRLAIARTLLYDPRVLVLDEATSNIDAESEKSIQDALAELIQGRTTIAIAHRLSTLKNADRILVFDRGLLIEQGSHAELLSQDGVYARLVRIQTQVSKDPNVDRLLRAARDASDRDAPTGEDARPDDRGTSEKSDASENGQAALIASNRLRWLDPAADQITRDSQGILRLQRAADSAAQPVFVVRTFAASHPESYLSLRMYVEHSDDVELGLIRHLSDWPIEAQQGVRQMLDRRYLLPRIERIFHAKLAMGFLSLDVDTDRGRREVSLRWTNSSAVNFGEDGKLLIDTEDNQFVVPDVEKLPMADREKFLQFIYW